MPSAITGVPIDEVADKAIRRISWRLLPFLTISFLICYIDRVNLGFAALQMNAAVGIDPKTYGLGAGILYLGYFFLEVPSNLALERFGARKWIGRIMISWGIVSMACALIRGPVSFLILRFLLGATEAGFFPGVVLYLTYWYPAEYRARIVGLLSLALPVAGLIGSPLSGAILGTADGIAALRGWQWLFIIEGAPAVVLGLLAPSAFLTDKPGKARWLPEPERQWLENRLLSENAGSRRVPPMPLWRVLSNKYVLIMALAYAGAGGAAVVLTLWVPQLVKSFGFGSVKKWFADSHPIRHRGDLHVFVGTQFRSYTGAGLAQCHPACRPRRSDIRLHLHHRPVRADADIADRHGGGKLCRQRTVLGAFVRIAGAKSCRRRLGPN